MTTFDHSQVTTAFELPGCKVIKNLGMVRGVVVRCAASLETLPPVCNRWSAGISRFTPNSVSGRGQKRTS